MPLLISCLSQKGGVGKSTLARLIARTYAVGGWTVKIADFNTRQLTSFKWTKLREENGHQPIIFGEAYNMPTMMRREMVDLIVADGRPDSDQSSLEIAKLSDLIVVPTGLPIDDLEPQLMFANELVEKGIDPDRIIMVLNKVTESEVAVREARQYLQNGVKFHVAKQDIAAKTAYQRAQNYGLALSEVGANVGYLEEKADLLAAEIVELATRLSENNNER